MTVAVAVVARGACSCGVLSFQVLAPPRYVCYCHCTSCRLALGQSPVGWATFALSQVLGLDAQGCQRYRSSAGVWRGRCVACAYPVSYEAEHRPGEVDLNLATLVPTPSLAQQFVPQAHIWLSDATPGQWPRDGLRQFAGAPP